VAGAAVTVRQRGGEALVFHADRSTDANGAMRFLGLPGGPLEVEALAPDTGARSGVQLEARTDTVSRVRIFLPVVGVVEGTVVTRGGEPVRGALVGVEDAEGLPATSGRDGSFTLKGLRTGRDYRLTARTPELVLDTPVTARAGQSGVKLVVRDRLVFRGRVVGAGGAPLRSFSVDGRPFEADDGRFAVPLEPREGQIEIRVAAPGMESRSVQSGSTVSELGDIVLEPARELRGRVTAGGQPVADAEVTAAAETVRTDRAGAFVLSIREPPPAGTSLHVHASKGDLAGSVDATTAGPVEIALAGEQPVRIRVLGPSGAPAGGRTVQLAGPRSYAWTAGAAGTVSGTRSPGTTARPTRSPDGCGSPVSPAPRWCSALRPARHRSRSRCPPAGGALGRARGGGGATSSERPGPRGEDSCCSGWSARRRFDGLAPGTWTGSGSGTGCRC
jgi:hypothetical protein